MLCSTSAIAQAPSAPSAADEKFAAALARDVNTYREARSLRPLVLDEKLSRIAHGHSVAMAKAGTMSHDDFPQRVRATGFAMCVENVGWNYASAQAQLDAWRASPGHARNMAHAGVEAMGVGVARGYVTLIACGA